MTTGIKMVVYLKMIL